MATTLLYDTHCESTSYIALIYQTVGFAFCRVNTLSTVYASETDIKILQVVCIMHVHSRLCIVKMIAT